MKSFVAEDSFWELFPQAAIGVVVVKGMKDITLAQNKVTVLGSLNDASRAQIEALADELSK